MEQKSINQLLTEYSALVRRGKYFIVLPFVIVLLLGTAIAFRLPPVFQSQVRLFYMQAQMPEWLEMKTVNMYMEAMLVFLEALAISPANCAKMIRDLNLYPDLIDTVPIEDLIEKMRSDYANKPQYTTVAGKAGRPEEVMTGFTVSFNHADPNKAFQVINVLATQFIENFKQFREGFAGQTSSFFEDERERLKVEIAELDRKMTVFKQENLLVLPEVFQSNFRMGELLRQKVFDIDQEILRLRAQQRNLEANLTTVSPMLSMAGISGERIVTPDEQLAAMRVQLDLLLSTYSEKHPDVIRTRNEIRGLENILAQRASGESGEGATVAGSQDYYFNPAGGQGAYNPVYVQLVSQLEGIKLDIEGLREEKREREKEMLQYEERIGQALLIEKEYVMLQRDLDNAKRRYNELSDQVLKLESAEQMERREMGGRLTIGSPPSFPLRPIKPNRLLIIVGSALAGLALGVGGLLGWDFLSRTVRTPEDVAQLTPLPVFAEIPLLSQDRNRRMQRISKNAVRIGAVVTIIVVVFLIDAFFMKVDVLFVKIVDIIRRKILVAGL
jgi:polysaccharide biosynthesis transport protein